MSLNRAITQLIKSRVFTIQKTKALQEQKKTMLEAVEEKYKGKQIELSDQLTGIEEALHALNIGEEEMEAMCDDYRKENNLPQLQEEAEDAA